MRYINLKAADGSNMQFARIAIGSTMAMERLSDEEKFAIYDYYVAHGGNVIDTARAYGNGHAEEMVGRYLSSRGNRDQLLVCTKGGHPTNEEPDKSRVNRACIMADLEKSLEVLGTDYVDMYWIHKDDPNIPIEEIVDTADEIVKAGKARKLGLSNFTSDRFAAALEYARKTGKTPFTGSQIQWSLAASEDRFFAMFGSIVMTPERYQFYMENGITVFSFSSQAQGFFSKVAAKGLESLPPFIVDQFGSADNMKRLEKVKAYAEAHNCSIAEVSLAYLLNNRLPCVSLIGAHNVDQLQQSLKAADLDMTPEEAEALYNV